MPDTPLAADLNAPFRFEYDPATLRYGPDAVRSLDTELDAQGDDRALVVCGATVGETPAVMDPVREGLGDQLAGVFAKTTPAKRLGTAYDGLERFREVDADCLVAVGGGSSLDVAKIISILAATDRDPAAVGQAFVDSGTIAVPETELPPIVAVPTTLAGADLSIVAGVTAVPDTCPVDEPTSGGVGDPKLMPAAVCYDPELIATTPRSVLAASAMNGFDKGIETLYAANSTPITDATASRGLGLLTDGLLALGNGDDDPWVYQSLTRGIMLVQYGISRADGTTLSLIHAFGHGLTRTYEVQQGAAHAVIAPHALSYLFEQVDGRRSLLADALGVGEASDPAAAVVDRVNDVVTTLGLPTRLRDVDGPDREAFPEVADAVLEDAFMANVPSELEPTRKDIVSVLESAW
ncbi:alcohol dehydrogenase [Haloarcula hispanica N601]|uniref:Alcohol dehydrogenase n=2 Tax=Haloarcula hispanica TaxID=51589 RepID=V5TNL8_HALHI|nr:MULTISPECIES: iron-containing alcohol dehydrogenase family protein [Haloarcula]AEM57491.1 alcohol dehydrogenase [Haloarcula hispanica ATCC 33960]AHB66255.1 alcohol dehydrogenase [Haloarcula hispanica N601]AJF24565.1 alcohol dehydrogenase [Haloarcula sp. CBA1115]MUV50131.1 iron-containing alcohol dehydrogenase [Haloarcula sp. CBA1122]